MIKYSLEEKEGVPTLMQRTFDCEGCVVNVDEWCTVSEIDSLFDACARKWGRNWNLEKVIVAIQESEIL